MSACEDFTRPQTWRIVRYPYGIAPQACSIVCVRAQQNIVKTNAESISGGVLQKLAVCLHSQFLQDYKVLEKTKGDKESLSWPAQHQGPEFPLPLIQ